MKKSPLMYLFLSAACLSIIGSCSKERIAPHYYQTVDELVSQTVINENIPGLVAAIADSSGILQIESAGERKVGSSEPLLTTDRFCIGSCTKAMTGALLATLVAEGKIGWETTILEVFPELRDTIHPDYHNITLLELLTNRSGIARDPDTIVACNLTDIMDRRLFYMKYYLKQPRPNPIGEYNYSNMGFSIAGIMAEHIMGKSWESLMTTRVFEPLGMQSAGFGLPDTIDVTQPWGHEKVDGAWTPSKHALFTELGPAGTVYCSIEDWAKFATLFFTHGDTPILERQFIDTLVEPVGNYACGWNVFPTDWANGNMISHGGSLAGWVASVWITPGLNRAFFVAMNSHGDHSIELMQKVVENLIIINRDYL